MRALLLALMPVLVILAFCTLCTLKLAPVPKYLEKRTPQPMSRAPGARRWRFGRLRVDL